MHGSQSQSFSINNLMTVARDESSRNRFHGDIDPVQSGSSSTPASQLEVTDLDLWLSRLDVNDGGNYDVSLVYLSTNFIHNFFS